MPLMTKDEMFAAITTQRLALLDQLDGLTPEQWNTASLCDGWRVRDVLGHLVSILDVPTWKFMIGVFSLAGFNRRADKIAREYGDRDPADLVTLYRKLAPKRMAPPGVGPIAPLTDVMTHSFDITRPLGLPAIYEPVAARAVLSKMAGGFPGFVSKKQVAGLRFSTTDLDWTTGTGAEVSGPVRDMLLVVAGRKAGLDGLGGPGVALLRERLG